MSENPAPSSADNEIPNADVHARVAANRRTAVGLGLIGFSSVVAGFAFLATGFEMRVISNEALRNLSFGLGAVLITIAIRHTRCPRCRASAGFRAKVCATCGVSLVPGFLLADRSEHELQQAAVTHTANLRMLNRSMMCRRWLHQLLIPGNDFAWSSWESCEPAIAELDNMIGTIESGQLPPRLTITALFAPTGPIQEVSLRSG